MSAFGLIFDVDGVIADTESVNARASIAVFEELFGLKGVRREDFNEGLGRGAAAYVRAAATVHGLELTDKEVEQATQLRQEKFLDILKNEKLDAFAGVLELIEEAISRDDFRLAIATSSTREKSQAVLDSVGIPWQQITYITGSDVSRKKPDPELFVTACRKAGVQAEKSVVIEDAPNGIEAAKNAGCTCIAVTNSAPAEKLCGADRIVNSLTEISIEDIKGLVFGK